MLCFNDDFNHSKTVGIVRVRTKATEFSLV